jgi:hypothetical protein
MWPPVLAIQSYFFVLSTYRRREQKYESVKNTVIELPGQANIGEAVLEYVMTLFCGIYRLSKHDLKHH